MDFELSEELKMIQSLTRDFVNERLKPLERDILGRAADMSDARRYLPSEKEAELIKMVRDMGLWGLNVPEELGGSGLDTLGICLVEEELAQTIVPFNFGDVSPLLFECSEEQRVKYLNAVLNGQKRPLMAMLESDSCSNVTSIKMQAQKNNGGYILDGRKISFSRLGDDYFAIVFAGNGRKSNEATCFLVDKGTAGFTVTGGDEKSGWLSSIREPLSLVFNKCRVLGENILGEVDKAFHLGRKWLQRRRIIRGARSVGVARRLLEEASTQAQSMETYGQLIHQRTGIQAALADIAMYLHAARLMVYEAASKADKNLPVWREAAMVKLFTTQTIHNIADRLSHIFNGPPYIEGLLMKRLYQHALATSTTEMTLELQRKIIARDILRGTPY
jgi:alkylation response protein AidB-like acyl-CoA dehydrogenase